MKDFLAYNNYFFLFAHPDDEVYVISLIHRLVENKKKVVLIYATSGDGGGKAKEREKEASISLGGAGVGKNNIYFLRIPEKKLLGNLRKTVNLSLEIIKKEKCDCIFGQDYEGGHEGHDAVSFCASELSRLAKIKNYFVFPIYHGKPWERKGARFKPQRKEWLTLKISKKEQEIKRKAISAHKGQQEHFASLQKSSGDYYKLLFSREVYFKIKNRVAFSRKPMAEVGYEYHRNGFKFRDFKKALGRYGKFL
jgi:LmbE family N-acetylglucosaminyl deacetylase